MTSRLTTYYSRTLDSGSSRLHTASLRRWLIRMIANAVLPLYYALTSRKSNYRIHPANGNQTSVIVSLSSYPARIGKVWICLETLLRQTVKPDMIILWLSRQQFPNGSADLPKRLKAMQSRGIDIRFTEEDYRSHRKYYYVLNEYPKDTIITVDDDIFYSPQLIEQLLSVHSKHPSAIVAAYTHGKLYGSDHTLLPYTQWHNNCMNGELFFGSGGGTLFPAGSLHPDVTDIQKAMELCPTADDVWLNMMAHLQHTAIVHIPMRILPLPVLSRHADKLSDVNVNENRNDIQIASVCQYYGETL